LGEAQGFALEVFIHFLISVSPSFGQAYDDASACSILAFHGLGKWLSQFQEAFCAREVGMCLKALDLASGAKLVVMVGGNAPRVLVPPLP
jgi:hypothetical protein